MSIPKNIIYIHMDLTDSPVLKMPVFNQFCIISAIVYNPDYDITVLVNKPVESLGLIYKSDKIKFKIIPQEYMREIEELGIKSVVQKSDYIRYRYLNEHGGIYSDTDVIMIKPLDSLLNNGMVLSYQSRVQICSGFVMSEPNRMTLYKTIEAYSNDYKPDSWAYNAMVVLQKNAKLYESTDGVKFLKYKEGFHFPHFNSMEILDEENPDIQSYCHHMWGSTKHSRGMRDRIASIASGKVLPDKSVYLDRLVWNIMEVYR